MNILTIYPELKRLRSEYSRLSDMRAAQLQTRLKDGSNVARLFNQLDRETFDIVYPYCCHIHPTQWDQTGKMKTVHGLGRMVHSQSAKRLFDKIQEKFNLKPRLFEI